MRDRSIGRPDGRRDDEHGAAGMVLNPLAQIRGRMFMAIVVGGRQLVMDFQRGGKRRQDNQHQSHCHSATQLCSGEERCLDSMFVHATVLVSIASHVLSNERELPSPYPLPQGEGMLCASPSPSPTGRGVG